MSKLHTIEIFVNKWTNSDSLRLVRAAIYGDEGDSPEELCERAFHIFNAPEEFLGDNRREILKDYHRKFPSLSVGDYVKITAPYSNESECYICKPIGWEKVESIPEGREMTLQEWRDSNHKSYESI